MSCRESHRRSPQNPPPVGNVGVPGHGLQLRPGMWRLIRLAVTKRSRRPRAPAAMGNPPRRRTTIGTTTKPPLRGTERSGCGCGQFIGAGAVSEGGPASVLADRPAVLLVVLG
ncbi:MAG: hypothetical protein AVDCRST_MAG73-3669 [uncultured Thermomicrobiales bacterium]|uniref:Uncharacterized protein n=1 Tax=uncultured Thermomicrobiales bacterium TaxID=1645740 RepID=A0A6J4UTS4_9BACT|nr:MAG: hypothetical protein AVDCRST_MAG73-3669 [uncultured Thermomicrobiales bacterium]